MEAEIRKIELKYWKQQEPLMVDRSKVIIGEDDPE